jgi:beta-lactamase class C
MGIYQKFVIGKDLTDTTKIIIITAITFLMVIPMKGFSLGSDQIHFIDHAIAAFMKEHDIPGVSVAIFDGKNDKFLSYGVMDKNTHQQVTENTIFEIASVTKVFTTTAIALHVLSGEVALKDPIYKFIPSLADKSKAISRITILELATHLSSLPRVGGNWHKDGFAKIVRFLQKWHPEEPIGSQYKYSNLGFGLLGYALENIENRSYEDVIKGDILLPLGMNMTFSVLPQSMQTYHATGYDMKGHATSRRHHGYIPGSGALRSNTRDLLKFLKANMAITGPLQLVKAMQFTQQPFYEVRKHFFMGLGWQRTDYKGSLLIDKNGGLTGFTSYVGWIPEKHLGIVILTNKGKARTTEVGRFILHSL